MARTAGKKQAPAKVDDDDTDGWEDAVVETAEGKDGGVDLRLRDWRDVERFREMKELRSLVDDDYGLEEIFRAPLKSRADVPPRQPKAAAPAKPAPKPVAAKAAKPPEKSPPKASKPAKAPPKAAPRPAKVKAKAKRR